MPHPFSLPAPTLTCCPCRLQLADPSHPLNQLLSIAPFAFGSILARPALLIGPNLLQFPHHVGTTFDALSIMEYPIPAGLANIVVGWNREITDKDRGFIAKTYPAKKAPLP